MPHALKISGLTFKYYENSKRNIIDNLSLEIEAGTVNLILGRSGCGKSSLAALAAGLYPENGGFLSSGEIKIFGHDINEMNHAERSKFLALMFQNPDLQFCMNTLRKELIFCLENISTPPEKMDEIIFNTASKFGMSEFLDRKFTTLSGGEKQKASLCCLMSLGSKIIILDEALANIDEKSSREIINFLSEYKNSGGTVIAIEHRLELWRGVADRYVIVGEGCKIIEDNVKPSEFEKFNDILKNYGIYGAYTGKKNFNKTKNKIAISLKNFSIENLIKESNIDFQSGKITALLGRSGAGKTTIFKAILKHHYYKGDIEINGKNLENIKERELFSEIGIVFQNPANQFVTQKVFDEIRAGNSASDETIEKLTQDFNLKQFEKYSPYMLSQGQQRRLAVLSMLVGNQKILLLDEPTYGQDLSSTEAIMTQLNSRVENENLTVIFITHDRELARAWADEILEINDNGQVIKCEK